MDQRILAAIHHTASQLLRRWFPFPELRPPTDADSSELSGMSVADWAHVVRDCLARRKHSLPWLARYQLKFDQFGQHLASTLYQNLNNLKAAGGRYVTFADQIYPQELRNLNDPPAAFSILGDPNNLSLPKVSIVGSRKASAFALKQSFALGRKLAEDRICVVSGGAFGCDIAAHRGVLTTEALPLPAIAVLAGGLREFFPKVNEAIFAEMLRKGAVFLSERLWSAPAEPHEFPIRNRLVAGLSKSTLIMQAARNSGAMITANLALEQGREVFVLIHPQEDVIANGGHALLIDGALGFEDAESFVEKCFVGYRVIESGDGIFSAT